jgi:hypothetical protein
MLLGKTYYEPSCGFSNSTGNKTLSSIPDVNPSNNASTQYARCQNPTKPDKCKQMVISDFFVAAYAILVWTQTNEYLRSLTQSIPSKTTIVQEAKQDRPSWIHEAQSYHVSRAIPVPVPYCIQSIVPHVQQHTCCIHTFTVLNSRSPNCARAHTHRQVRAL